MSKKIKVSFTGSGEHLLAGLLEVPSGSIRAFALFAHCFTCGKDVVAASRISRSLVAQGIAVMRFDFTGLGNSDGDFSNTNFSSNVEDLISAANFLRDQYVAPSLLIGHSLGGTAILHAAQEIPDAQGVVTIGSPAKAIHVSKQFSVDLENININGSAVVNLAGRSFTIKKQFLDDLQSSSEKYISKLRKALLILVVYPEVCNLFL
ncbi:MAG: alpha/beta fold hydrolase [Gammaproteobacteria bacterium]|nr:alpha/beta fold hydrolase [Gammaproteobacteria bacterium]